MKFNLDTAVVVVPKTKKVVVPNGRVVKRDVRYVITREMGVADRIILKVYDKIERANVFFIQGPIRKGHQYTQYVKNQYRSNEFIDKLDDSHVLFEY